MGTDRKRLIYCATVPIILYLFGAFVAADWNFANWDIAGRLVLGGFALMTIVTILTAPKDAW